MTKRTQSLLRLGGSAKRTAARVLGCRTVATNTVKQADNTNCSPKSSGRRNAATSAMNGRMYSAETDTPQMGDGALREAAIVSLGVARRHPQEGHPRQKAEHVTARARAEAVLVTTMPANASGATEHKKGQQAKAKGTASRNASVASNTSAPAPEHDLKGDDVCFAAVELYSIYSDDDACVHLLQSVSQHKTRQHNIHPSFWAQTRECVTHVETECFFGREVFFNQFKVMKKPAAFHVSPDSDKPGDQWHLEHVALESWKERHQQSPKYFPYHGEVRFA